MKNRIRIYYVTCQYINWCGAIATEGVDRASAVEKCVACSFCLMDEGNKLF